MGIRGRKLQKPKVVYKSRTMTIRKTISKALRQQVYAKYDGHCAYCGCELEYKDMQVDHIVAVGRHFNDRPMTESLLAADNPDREANDIILSGDYNRLSNLMPACRKCNFYKSMGDIEELRSNIKNVLTRSCTSTFVVQLALKYGILSLHQWDGKFYFERENNKLKH